MAHKHIQDMTKDEYQAFVRRLKKRHGPEKKWEDLPVIRLPGRPAKGTKRRPLVKNFNDYLKKVTADRRARIEEAARRKIAVIRLQQAREKVGITQEEFGGASPHEPARAVPV